MQGTVRYAGEMQARIDHLKAGIAATPGATEADATEVRRIAAALADINVKLTGDSSVTSRNESAPWPIATRSAIVYAWLLSTRADVPQLYRDSYAIAAEQFGGALASVRALDADLRALEAKLEGLGAPYTPGRLPTWSAGN